MSNKRKYLAPFQGNPLKKRKVSVKSSIPALVRRAITRSEEAKYTGSAGTGLLYGSGNNFSPIIQLIGIGQGNDNNARIGRKIKLKSLQFSFDVNIQASAIPINL